MTLNNKLTKADEKEMVSDARQYLKAAGVRNPTAAEIVALIHAEHGIKLVIAKRKRPKLGGIFGFRVAAVARALGAAGWMPADAITAIHSMVPKASKLAIRTYVQAGRAGVRGEPAKLNKKQFAELKAAVA